jgi:hypothetical protein
VTQIAAPMSMSGVAPSPRARDTGAARFAAVGIAVAVAAALLAGWTPLGFSIVTVFLFAGPHNWMEFRYFLSQMPARWGPLRGFFTLAIGGVLALTGAFASLPTLASRFNWDGEQWVIAAAAWNSVFVLWVATLAHLRSRQHPKRDWWAVWPAALAVVAAVWVWPWAWDLGLVYLHPLVALFFLDRLLKKKRPEWLGAYRLCLGCVPLLLAALWWNLIDSPMLAGQDMLTMRITQHAGAEVLRNVSSHALVSTHTFLEMLHYGVWLVAIPLVGLRVAPWKLAAVPLARRGEKWRFGVGAFIALGAVVVVTLWACFLADYPATRDAYFTVAMLHVLAEFPFLLRTL